MTTHATQSRLAAVLALPPTAALVLAASLAHVLPGPPASLAPRRLPAADLAEAARVAAVALLASTGAVAPPAASSEAASGK